MAYLTLFFLHLVRTHTGVRCCCCCCYCYCCYCDRLLLSLHCRCLDHCSLCYCCCHHYPLSCCCCTTTVAVIITIAAGTAFVYTLLKRNLYPPVMPSDSQSTLVCPSSKKTRLLHDKRFHINSGRLTKLIAMWMISRE